MNKEKESIIARILFWPMFSMNESIEIIHSEMDKTAPDDPWLEEDKHGIGIGGAFSGCIMTLLWLVFLMILFVIIVVLLVTWMF